MHPFSELSSFSFQLQWTTDSGNVLTETVTVAFASPPSDGRTAYITCLQMCFINYVTEVHFPSREVVVMSCHSGELKKDYFAITILVYFFFSI